MWLKASKRLIEMTAAKFVIVVIIGLAVKIRAQFADKCEFQVHIRNNFIILLNRTEMNFRCHEKYTRHSIPLKKCSNEQGTWINCLDGFKDWMKCGYPGYPSNGYIYIDSSMQLSYACNHGFILLGKRVRQCSTRGTWSPIIPKCVKNLAKDIDFKQLIDENLLTSVTLDANALSLFDLKTEINFDGVKIRFKNWNKDNKVTVYSSLIPDNKNVNKIAKRDQLHSSDAFQEIQSDTPHQLKLARYLMIWPIKTISIYEIYIFNSNEETTCNRPDEPIHGRIKTITSNLIEFECDQDHKLYGQISAFCVRGIWQYLPPECRNSPNAPTTSTSTTQAPKTTITPGRQTTLQASPTTLFNTKTPVTITRMITDKHDDGYNKANLSLINNDENDMYHTNIGVGIGVVAVCIILITTMCFIKWYRADRKRKNAGEKTNSNLINSESQQHSKCAKVENANNPVENLNSEKFSDLLISDENSASNVYADCSLPISSNDNDDGNYAVPILPDDNDDTINVENDYYVSY